MMKRTKVYRELILFGLIVLSCFFLNSFFLLLVIAFPYLLHCSDIVAKAIYGEKYKLRHVALVAVVTWFFLFFAIKGQVWWRSWEGGQCSYIISQEKIDQYFWCLKAFFFLN